MAKKATPQDAQIIMKLYDLRREPELRKARDWWLTKFWPDTAEDFMKIAGELGSQENNWLRQVGGYWGMAAALVSSGAVSRDLFLQPAISGEMFFMFAKVRPFLPELREKLGDAQAFRGIEEVVMSTKWSRERIKLIEKRVAGAKARAQSLKSS